MQSVILWIILTVMMKSRNRLFTLPCIFLSKTTVLKKTVIYNHENISLFTTVLLLCGDIETCPDPATLSELCKCRGLKFVYQNIRGLMYNFTSLEVLVYKEGSKVNVLGLSETHITDGDEGDYAGLFKRLHTDQKKSQP